MEIELVHGLPVLPVDRRHGDEVCDMPELPLELRALAVLGALADPPETERAERALVAAGLADGAPDLGDANGRHAVSSVAAGAASAAASAGACSGSTGEGRNGRTSLIDFPRDRATSSGRRSRLRPSTVARAMLIGFVVPRLFERTSRIPASSSTARTPPPAITPVPSLAGRRTTRAASNLPTISCVIVAPCFGTVKRFFFASSTAFEMASGTSRAFPYPTPTRSTSSPMTTRAVNEKRRPPLTTFATLLISITRSLSSRDSATSTALMSELESSLARGLGQRLDASVVQVAAPVEDAGVDSGLLRIGGQRLADRAGLIGLRPLERALREPARGGERPPGLVVDELREDASVRAEDDEARPLGRPGDLAA